MDTHAGKHVCALDYILDIPLHEAGEGVCVEALGAGEPRLDNFLLLLARSAPKPHGRRRRGHAGRGGEDCKGTGGMVPGGIVRGL